MIKLKSILTEILKEVESTAGQSAGEFELIKTPLEVARKYIEDHGHDPDTFFDNFDVNYKFAQKRAGTGRTKRKDMPVIEQSDIRDLQARLKLGYIDVNKPFARDTNERNPFPEGLTDKEATRFMSNGLRDMTKPDDIVKVQVKRIPVGNLKPIQKQIYFDKSAENLVKFGISASKKFLQNSILIASSDNYIIDGHHRYLSSILIDPKLPVKVLTIDLPLNKLLPLSLAYGDAMGNKRNT